MKKFAVLASVIALSAVSCFEPDENDPPPWLGSYNAALCQYELSDVLLVVETSARMGMPSGYKQGNKDISRDELVVDALKRTLPHVKKMVDFGLLTFPFVDHRDGNPAAPDACTVGERIIDPGSPYGWIVSRLEHIESGGKASVAGALLKAYDYYRNSSNPIPGVVVLFTAGGDECGGDILAAIDLLASISVPTVVISFENASHAELLAQAALRGGHQFRQNAEWGKLKYLTDKTGHADLQSMLEAADLAEICDGIDNDCDGLIDEDFDADHDGWAECAGDVDDDPLVYPGASDDENIAPYTPPTIIDWFQGPDSNNDPIDATEDDPTDALVNEPGAGGGGTFPLGYYGFVEVAFACPVRNGPGPDLRVIDGRFDDEWTLETADVYAWDVSVGGWVLLGTATNTGVDPAADTASEFDLGALPWAARFRIVNSTPVQPNGPLSDGFDVDGIYALQDCESCDGIDNDDDGVVDGGFGIGQVCTQITGVCVSEGIRVCAEDGTTSICEAPAIEVSAEVCNGLDDDCDGIVDGLVIDCATRCGTGHRTCEGGNWGDCVIDVPALELCDGLDNDCDGSIDEDFPLGDGCRVGGETCGQTGVYACTADKLDVYCHITGIESGSPEICNGLDDDCDGTVDNGADLCADGQICFMGQCVYD